MQNAMRRTLGVGGATAVAIGATLALAGVASAHNHTVGATCDTDAHSATYGKSLLSVNLSDYVDTPNYLTIVESPVGSAKVTLYAKANFGSAYQKTFVEDGTIAQSYEVTVSAHSKQFSFDQTVTTQACLQPTQPTTAPPTTVPPTKPPTAPPTAPPTKPSSSTPPPPVTTTSAAPVAAAAPGSTPPGGLAYTGVSAELPLIIGGALVVLGGGALFGMRFAAKRRRAQQ